jgi:hypothetical protein
MELMLIIEVDGITHHWEETILKDKRKQIDLESADFTVLRFTDDEVLNDINAVHWFLENWIENKINGESKSTPFEICFISNCFPRKRGTKASLSILSFRCFVSCSVTISLIFFVQQK